MPRANFALCGVFLESTFQIASRQLGFRASELCLSPTAHSPRLPIFLQAAFPPPAVHIFNAGLGDKKRVAPSRLRPLGCAMQRAQRGVESSEVGLQLGGALVSDVVPTLSVRSTDGIAGLRPFTRPERAWKRWSMPAVVCMLCPGGSTRVVLCWAGRCYDATWQRCRVAGTPLKGE